MGRQQQGRRTLLRLIATFYLSPLKRKDPNCVIEREKRGFDKKTMTRKKQYPISIRPSNSHVFLINSACLTHIGVFFPFYILDIP